MKSVEIRKNTLKSVKIRTSSDRPPDKKTMPGTAAGMVRLKALIVARPTSAGVVETKNKQDWFETSFKDCTTTGSRNKGSEIDSVVYIDRVLKIRELKHFMP